MSSTGRVTKDTSITVVHNNASGYENYGYINDESSGQRKPIGRVEYDWNYEGLNSTKNKIKSTEEQLEKQLREFSKKQANKVLKSLSKNEKFNVLFEIKSILTFANKLDILLLVLGSGASFGMGFAVPIQLLMYGSVTDHFASNANSIRNSTNTTMSDSKTSNLDLPQMLMSSVYTTVIGIGVQVLGYIAVSFWRIVTTRLSTRMDEKHHKVVIDPKTIGDRLIVFVRWFVSFVLCNVVGFFTMWKLSFAIVCMAFVIAIGASVLVWVNSKFDVIQKTAYKPSGDVAAEALNKIRTVHAFSSFKTEQARYSDKLNATKMKGILRGVATGLATGYIDLCLYCTQGLTMWYGAKLIRQDGNTPGDVLKVFFGILFGAVSLAQAIPTMKSAGMKKIISILNILLDGIVCMKRTIFLSDGVTPRIEGHIEFTSVCFQYPTSRQHAAETIEFTRDGKVCSDMEAPELIEGLKLKVEGKEAIVKRSESTFLFNLTFEACVGQTVAIVGCQGSGKTTIIRLLQKLLTPTAGVIRIDGLSISEINTDWLQENISVINRAPVVWHSSTISDNIRFGCEAITAEDVQRAARDAGAHDFIMRLPKKYKTIVGKNGGQLSWGQKQRIVIARALVNDTKILVLDDATSSFDLETETYIYEMLRQKCRNRTIIIASQRLTSVRHADVILTMRDGAVCEMGAHQELMAKRGRYYSMMADQDDDDFNDSYDRQVADDVEVYVEYPVDEETDSDEENVEVDKEVLQEEIKEEYETLRDDKLEEACVIKGEVKVSESGEKIEGDPIKEMSPNHNQSSVRIEAEQSPAVLILNPKRLFGELSREGKRLIYLPNMISENLNKIINVKDNIECFVQATEDIETIGNSVDISTKSPKGLFEDLSREGQRLINIPNMISGKLNKVINVKDKIESFVQGIENIEIIGNSIDVSILNPNGLIGDLSREGQGLFNIPNMISDKLNKIINVKDRIECLVQETDDIEVGELVQNKLEDKIGLSNKELTNPLKKISKNMLDSVDNCIKDVMVKDVSKDLSLGYIHPDYNETNGNCQKGLVLNPKGLIEDLSREGHRFINIPNMVSGKLNKIMNVKDKMESLVRGTDHIENNVNSVDVSILNPKRLFEDLSREGQGLLNIPNMISDKLNKTFNVKDKMEGLVQGTENIETIGNSIDVSNLNPKSLFEDLSREGQRLINNMASGKLNKIINVRDKIECLVQATDDIEVGKLVQRKLELTNPLKKISDNTLKGAANLIKDQVLKEEGLDEKVVKDVVKKLSLGNNHPENIETNGDCRKGLVLNPEGLIADLSREGQHLINIPNMISGKLNKVINVKDKIEGLVQGTDDIESIGNSVDVSILNPKGLFGDLFREGQRLINIPNMISGKLNKIINVKNKMEGIVQGTENLETIGNSIDVSISNSNGLIEDLSRERQGLLTIPDMISDKLNKIINVKDKIGDLVQTGDDKEVGKMVQRNLEDKIGLSKKVLTNPLKKISKNMLEGVDNLPKEEMKKEEELDEMGVKYITKEHTNTSADPIKDTADGDTPDSIAYSLIGELSREGQRLLNIPNMISDKLKNIINVEDKKDDESQAMKRLIQLNLPDLPFVLIGYLCGVGVGAVRPLFAVVLGKMLAALSDKDFVEMGKLAFYYSKLMALAGVASAIFQTLQSTMLAATDESSTQRLREKVFESMLNQDIEWHDDKDNDLVNLCEILSDDARIAQGASFRRYSAMVEGVANLLSSVIVALTQDFRLALVALAFVPPLALGKQAESFFTNTLTRCFDIAERNVDKVVKIVQRKVEDTVGFSEEQLTNTLQATEQNLLNNWKKAIGLVSDFMPATAKKRLDDLTTEVMMKVSLTRLIRQKEHKISLLRGQIKGLCEGFVRSMHYFAFSGVFAYGAVLVAQGEMQFEAIVQVFEAVTIGTLAYSAASTEPPKGAKNAVLKIFKLLDREPSIRSSQNGDGIKIVDSEFRGRIEFQNVVFRYPHRPNIRVLTNLDTYLDSGDTLALLGRTGSGKSSILQLLLRFYDPIEGEILLDGYDIKTMDVEFLRSKIGYVDQEPVLFDATIKENIAYGDGFRDVDTYDIIAAAKKANIHDVVVKLPEGYDTHIGKNGVELSGSEKQLVALSRVFLRNPDIILLDQAPNALVKHMQAVITCACKKDKITCVTTSNCPTVVKAADKVVVVNNGHFNNLNEKQSEIPETPADELSPVCPKYGRVSFQLDGCPNSRQSFEHETVQTDHVTVEMHCDSENSLEDIKLDHHF